MLDFRLGELSVWEKLENEKSPIIMYGTGNGADKVFSVLDGLGVSVAGVTASSGFVRERSFHGFTVKPLEYFENKYKVFTVIVTFGSSLPEVIGNIKKIAERHRVLVPCVPVIGDELFDRQFVERNAEKINYAYSLLADEFSKKVFSGYVNFQFGGELADLFSTESSEDEAYENILKLGKNETFADIGAYRGDTVEKFLKYTGGNYNEIIAAEPDFKTYGKLMRKCGDMANFKGVNAAVTDVDGEIPFSQNAGRQSAVGGNGAVKSVTLGTLCADSVPTFIKIDSEGCEYDILNGGKTVLERFKPKLNVAAYHKSKDVFELPILIEKINAEYKIFLRHHPYIPAWDTIVYCV